MATNPSDSTSPETDPLHQSAPPRNNPVREDNRDHGRPSNAPVTVTPAKTSRSESALAWFQRCQQHQRQQKRRRRCQDRPPETPAAAAWAFFRGTGTGIPFVDASLRRNNQNAVVEDALPALELRDSTGDTGKTRAIVALAARFVVSTRSSLFVSSSPANPRNSTTNDTNAMADRENSPTNAPEPIEGAVVTGQTSEPPLKQKQKKHLLPHVILLDSTMDVTSLHLVNAVSSQLIRHHQQQTQQQQQQQQTHPSAAASLEYDIASSVRRIHYAHVDDPREWVAVLESLRCQLLLQRKKQQEQIAAAMVGGDEDAETEVSTLLLWDGFLSEPGTTQGIQKEVARQLALLLKDCHVGLIYTTSASFGHWVTPHSLLQSAVSSSESKNDDTTHHNSTWRQQPVVIPQTVVLERDDTPGARHDFVATLATGQHGIQPQIQIPYSLSGAGILG